MHEAFTLGQWRKQLRMNHKIGEILWFMVHEGLILLLVKCSVTFLANDIIWINAFNEMNSENSYDSILEGFNILEE